MFLLFTFFVSLILLPDFGRVCDDDSVFLVDYIVLDRSGTVKVFEENGSLRGLPFFVLDERTCISEYWSQRKA